MAIFLSYKLHKYIQLFIFVHMRDCFFDILAHLERAKRKDPRSSFTKILHKCGVNELEIGHNIINNWTNPLKIKDNRSDTDEEIMNRLTTYWLSQKGEEYKKEIKDSKDGK